MSEKDDAYNAMLRVLYQRSDICMAWWPGIKVISSDNKGALFNALRKACNAYTYSRAELKSEIMDVLRCTPKYRRGYDCAKKIADALASGDADTVFAKLAEEPFKRFFTAGTFNSPVGAFPGLQIKDDDIPAFIGAVTDVVFAKDAPMACNVDVFIFYELRHFSASRQSDDDLAEALADAVEKKYHLKG